MLRACFCLVPVVAATLLSPGYFTQAPFQARYGLFTGSSDIGTAQPGESHFDPASQSYTLRGGGNDVWGSADAFHFLWTQLPENETLSADVRVAHPGTFPKAKGMLMFRQSLDPGSPYADVAVHADGHITLQYRLTQGGVTKDTDLPESGPVRLQIERKGNTYTASVLAGSGSPGHSASITLTLSTPPYVGLGVCSHSTTELQTVTFSRVVLTPARNHQPGDIAEIAR